MGETAIQPLPAQTTDLSISGLRFIAPLCTFYELSHFCTCWLLKIVLIPSGLIKSKTILYVFISRKLPCNCSLSNSVGSWLPCGSCNCGGRREGKVAAGNVFKWPLVDKFYVGFLVYQLRYSIDQTVTMLPKYQPKVSFNRRTLSEWRLLFIGRGKRRGREEEIGAKSELEWR